MSNFLNALTDDKKLTEPVTEVVIDGLAVLKIVKHCNDNLPTMVAGSLLGLDVNGILEVTYVYPFLSPQSKADIDTTIEGGIEDLDGESYQLEMMKMLQKVNVDNNCVGWYTSMYFGSMYTMENVNYQFSYQASEELSDNCVVIMYDPIQSKNGNLLLKAFRLSDRFMEIRRRKSNEFLKPSDILVELPVKIKNNGHVSAFLRCLSDTHASDIDCNFEPLSLSGSDGFTEQSFDVITHVIDDLLHEQTRFQLYSKGTSKLRQEYVKWLNRRVQENNERKENGENQLPIDFQGLKPIPDAPQRGETLLVLGQLERYCKQIKDHVDSSYHKLIVTSQLNSASKVDK